MSADELQLVNLATTQIAAWPLHIADRGEFTAAGIRSYARRRAMKTPPALLITDHIGLAKVTQERRRDPRVQQVGDICKQFKEMAAELECPHLVAAQLNRQVEGRAVKVPQLSDLRESGDIEQDAYSVSFLHRHNMGEEAALHLAKNRNGPLAKVTLRYDGRTARFASPAYEEVPGYDY